ncbi:carbohydrate ABC transporter permease [Pseudogracilibacillus auburnensis]|uniref:carbohydrate ABC transporter permease n=1 Tax=Pseudogracilibacillus auburnensis TaxID=1494959 RepID=UPI001A978D66|nr:carbohydrate ABC transporter permease [Pseudogracilibacillus auburnensis]MBO1004833.1 carbohydrate ABC transporter permease [Pseudogracilibacillus auburnensis]
MANFRANQMDPDRFHLSQLGFYFFLLTLGGFMILPIIFIFSTALKPIDELFLYPPRFLVIKPTLQNFGDLFNTTAVTVIPMSKYLFNSIFITATVVFGTIIISTMTGFALSKLDFKMKNIIFEANILAIMFVPAAVAIPRYFIVEKLGLTDTMLGHILPLLALPVSVFLVKQFIDQIPDSLIEAARIDGANNYQVFFRIIIPMVKPALATVAILSFQLAWNNAETSVLYMDSENLKTLAFYMTTLSANIENNVAGQGMAAAASLLMFLPNLIIFLFMQSKVMNTMAQSGLK